MPESSGVVEHRRARDMTEPGGVSLWWVFGGGSGGGLNGVIVVAMRVKLGAGFGRGEGGLDAAEPELGVWSNQTRPG